MLIRWAGPDDAAAIAEVHVAAWRGAYRGLMPAEFLAGLRPARQVPNWERRLATGTWPGDGTLVAVRADLVIGFANVGRTRDEDATAETGELRAINVTPRSWGGGAGRGLLAEAERVLAEAGYRVATLWVLDGNARARRFYTAGGWEPDGATKVDRDRGFPLTELRYRRAL